MFDERKKERIKFYKKISQTVKEYESAVINTALDSLKEDLSSKMSEVSEAFNLEFDKLYDLHIRKARLQFWKDFSCYDFVQPAKIFKVASKRGLVYEKKCLKLDKLPPAKLCESKESTLITDKYMIVLNDGCYYEFSRSEKEKAIKYLKDNNIPLNLLLFKDVLNLAFYGVIEIEEEKEKTK